MRIVSIQSVRQLRSIRLMLLLALCLGGGRATTAAQQNAVLSGTVVDAVGGVLAGVTITITEEKSGSRATTTSDQKGRFAFSSLPAGRYRLEGQLAGFATAMLQDVEIPSSRRVELVMGPGALREAVTVTATRTATPIAAVPASVTVLTRETLEQQGAVTRNLHTILAKTVPGFGLSRETESNFGQNLRGRGMLVLLDGVPQNFELRQGALDELSRIDLSRIDSVEVVRGASAAYGSEATGGIINIITKSGRASAPTLRSDMGTTFSGTHAGDSGTFRLAQDIGGANGRADYFASGALETNGSVFDAEGDRIPEIFPVGVSETTSVDLGGRVGVRATEQQRLSFSLHMYRARRDITFGSTDGIFGVQKARAIRLPVGIGDPADAGFPAERPYKQQGTYRVDYRHVDVAGSQLSAQVLHLRYRRMNDYFSFGGGQLNPRFRKTGARLDLQTPLRLTDGAALTWGTDYVFYHHHEPVNTGFTWTPPLDQQSLAGFAQASIPLGRRVTVRGGIRYEDFTVDIDDFQQNPAFGSRNVSGGTLDYDASTVNIGGIVAVVEDVQLFAGFNQGFSITQVGRLLVNTRLASVAEARPEPAKVDSYEVGIRGGWPQTQFSLAGFYATSDLGTSLVVRGIGPPEVIRAPERTFGVEATIDLQQFPLWRWGGAASWQDGEHDPEFDGIFTPMPGWRIAPVKLTGYAEHMTLRSWQNRVQVTYSGNRDEFPGSDAFGEGPVKDVTLVDFVTSVRLPQGTITAGVENLLNAFYFPPINQAFNDDFNYIAGRGRSVSVNYAIQWRR